MTLVFDTEPLVAFLSGEASAPRVAALLSRVEAARERGVVSRVNLAELVYVATRRGLSADAHVRDLARRGLETAPCEPAWAAAARYKARHADLSLADAFALGTARALEARLVVVGDEPLAQACHAEGVALLRV